ncbi:hypothetical protein [Paenibacillus sp. BJ-4]|nr:hypothetical protein [Paenibacillus sp. BJ-4]
MLVIPLLLMRHRESPFLSSEHIIQNFFMPLSKKII